MNPTSHAAMSGGWAVTGQKTRGGAGRSPPSGRQHGPRFLPNRLGLDGQGVADPALKEMKSAEGCQTILREGSSPEGPRPASHLRDLPGSVSAARRARPAKPGAPHPGVLKRWAAIGDQPACGRRLALTLTRPFGAASAGEHSYIFCMSPHLNKCATPPYSRKSTASLPTKIACPT